MSWGLSYPPPVSTDYPHAMLAHSVIDARSREAHVLVAARIERDPSLRQIALENLDRWMVRSSRSQPYFLKWRELLLGDLAELLEVMRSDTEASCALRQCTPFAGPAFISQAERLKLLQKYAAR
jgi:hypothetical protein